MAKGTALLLEQLTIAYKTELTGYAFYKYASQIITDESGKNVFNHIANEELEHMAVISAIADSLRDGLGLLGYEAALRSGKTAMDKKGLPIFPKENELISKLKNNPTDQNAVLVAVNSEEKAVEFYSDMLKHAESSQEKVLLTHLLEMEKGHLKLFRWELESLVETGFWCDMMEYSVEKETE